VDDARAQRALWAHKQLVRIARHPEREPAWLQILADLVEAEAFYRGLESRTADQSLTYFRIREAMKGR